MDLRSGKVIKEKCDDVAISDSIFDSMSTDEKIIDRKKSLNMILRSGTEKRCWSQLLLEEEESGELQIAEIGTNSTKKIKLGLDDDANNISTAPDSHTRVKVGKEDILVEVKSAEEQPDPTLQNTSSEEQVISVVHELPPVQVPISNNQPNDTGTVADDTVSIVSEAENSEVTISESGSDEAEKIVEHICLLKKYTQVEIPSGCLANSYRSGVHSKYVLMRLMDKASNHLSSNGGVFDDSPYFYRDKDVDYFTDIMDHHGGLMEVYRKDQHGDQRSPINGNLNGLFFNVNNTSHSRCNSIFGSKRIKIPPEFIVNTTPNLYFADFYCSRTRRERDSDKDYPHFVTLVMTKSGSESDKFCENNLIHLPSNKNSFLQISEKWTGEISMEAGLMDGKFWVEVLVTEDVNLGQAGDSGAQWGSVNMMGKRLGGMSGLPKRSSCSICNV